MYLPGCYSMRFTTLSNYYLFDWWCNFDICLFACWIDFRFCYSYMTWETGGFELASTIILVLQANRLTKELSKKFILKGSGPIWNQTTVSRYNHSQSIWQLILGFMQNGRAGKQHYGKSLTSVFRDFLASINKTYILPGGLGTRL